ncbi:MAG: uncharacterized protein K0Q70_258 [Rhodospirillales bacterium]|nr:uncharacterized protein [Rhodospirillales bacterium]
MRRVRFLIIAAVSLGALTGCSDTGLFGSKIVPPSCPTASILEDANRITVYRPGPGRDIADIVYEARLLGVEGDCAYEIDKKGKTTVETTYKSVTMNMRPRFIVTPGPALTGFSIPIHYFVAMPEFYPNPEGRADFSRNVETSSARTQVDVTDANIDIRVPLNEKRRGESIGVFIGFVLTDEQLRENRSRSSGRLFR